MATQTEMTLRQERQGVLGGSDIGALFNLDFGCKRKLQYDKSGREPDFPEVYRPEFERGHYMEEVVAKLYADKTGRPVQLAPRHIHPEKSYMVVHMDRIITAPEHAGEGYLEIKVVNYRTFKKFKAEGLRESYILQVQHGLAVTGYQWGSFAILCLDPWDFKWFDVDRDPEIIARLYEVESRFMQDLTNGAEYVRLPANDKRCATCVYRQSCQGEAITNLIPQDERDAELVDAPELLPLAAEANELRTMQADLEAMMEETNRRAMEIIDRYAVTKEDGVTVYPKGARYPGGRTLRMQNKGSKKWDAKALWALWEKATPRLKELLGPYCNNGKEGKSPNPYLRHYWTGEK